MLKNDTVFEATLVHPDQPLIKDEKGIIRFKANGIVRHLVDKGLVNLTEIVHWASGVVSGVNQNDLDQWYQLMGYSIGGYAELVGSDVISEEAADRSETKAKELAELLKHPVRVEPFNCVPDVSVQCYLVKVIVIPELFGKHCLDIYFIAESDQDAVMNSFYHAEVITDTYVVQVIQLQVLACHLGTMVAGENQGGIDRLLYDSDKLKESIIQYKPGFISQERPAFIG